MHYANLFWGKFYLMDKTPIKTNYKSPMAHVTINNVYSHYFPLYCGTRQSCPLSCSKHMKYAELLMALSTEPLAWLHIESSYCGNTSLQSLMSSALLLELNSYRHNPVVHQTLTNTDCVQCRKRFGLHLMSSCAPMSCNVLPTFTNRICF